MAQKNNQQQEEKAYSKEDAFRSLEMINMWISNIDTKVSFALALVGVIVGMILGDGLPNSLQRVGEVSRLAELNGGEILAAVLVCLLYTVSFSTVMCFMFSIVPRVKNLNNSSSVFFFGSIGKMSLQNYKDRVRQMTEKQIIDDLKEQIHTNSKICSQKTKWYNIGTKFLFVTIILWFVSMVFRLI